MLRSALLPALFLAALCLAAVLPADARQAGENPPMPGFDLAGSDARAIEIADAVMERLGGRAAWDGTRYLSWGFGGADQVWDKWTGAFRYQREDLVVLMNVNTRDGRAWENGQPLADPAEALERAYGAWVNSGYWFMMPYKLKDSGVTLKYLGERATEDGRAADVLQLTFDGVGLTPQNKYHVFVDRETRLVTQWQYYQQATDAEPRFTRPWRNWRRHGRIMLSDDRGEGRNGPFILPNIGAYDTLPESVFTSPDRLDLSTLPALSAQ